MNVRVDLDLQRLPRGGWIIVEGQQQVVPKVYDTEEDAAYRLPQLTRQLQLERATWRPCLNCTAKFPSMGAHNRLCDTCRIG
jgi:hypothetical protein